MGDLKPLGSEKLSGDEKLKRILELTYYKTEKKPNSNNKPEIVKESSSGVYGIVKEKDGYYVKKGLNENSLDYIGGLFMKNKNKFSSYAEALKRMQLLSGQESLQEATKYVLKQKPKESSDVAPSIPDTPPTDMGSESGDAPPPPSDDMGAPTGIMGGDTSMEPTGNETPTPETGTESPEGEKSSKRSDYMAEIQKFAGKLGQQLRDEKEKMESDDIKYVLNMVISAVDLDKLEDEDIEEIGKKFDRDEQPTEEPSGEESPETEEPSGEESPETEEPSDEDLGETMSKLSQFIKSSAPSDTDEIDLSKYADIDEDTDTDELKEIDLDEIKNEINKSINDTLSKYFK